MAEGADKFDLYQKSVQHPDHEVEFFEQAYREAFDRKPWSLREDFCGTFAVCCQWVLHTASEPPSASISVRKLCNGAAITISPTLEIAAATAVRSDGTGRSQTQSSPRRCPGRPELFVLDFQDSRRR